MLSEVVTHGLDSYRGRYGKKLKRVRTIKKALERTANDSFAHNRELKEGRRQWLLKCESQALPV